jgi:hypothetical protein
MFNGGRTNVHGEERPGRPSPVTEDWKNRIDQHVRTNRAIHPGARPLSLRTGKTGLINTSDKQGDSPGHPSLVTGDWKNRIDQHVRTNRAIHPGTRPLSLRTGKTGLINTSGQTGRFTLDEIREKFPQIFPLLIHEIVTERLHYEKKICARWVPWMLTEGYESKCMGAALTFLGRYHQEGYNFLHQILVVTGIET